MTMTTPETPRPTARKRHTLDKVATAPVRRRRRIIIACVLAVLVLAGAIWLLWFSSVLTVKQVRVVGVEGTLADQALATAAVPVGIHLARLDTDAAAARVLELGWVATAEVRRGWPSEAVVAVTPRSPIAAMKNSTTSGVDAEGVAFDVDPSVLKGLPLVDATDDALVESMKVLVSLPPDIAKRVDAVAAQSKDSVELTLRSGDLVRWGSAERAEEKVAVLRALMDRRAEVIDVTSPETPTIFR